MTATPITPERLSEIAALCTEIDGHAYDVLIPELLAEVARLQGVVLRLANNERDLAETNLVLEQQDRDLERQRAHIAALQAGHAEMRQGCEEWRAGCDERDTDIRAHIAEIARLRSDLDHATAHDGDHLSRASRRMVDTVMGDRDALRVRVAALESELLESSEQHGVYRDRAQLLADRVLADELRITALETGLREALAHIDEMTPGGPGIGSCEQCDRLRLLADGVQSQGAT